MTEYSAEVLSLLADLRESVEKQKARISDETEAERCERSNYQHRLQNQILAAVQKDAWEAAGKVLTGRAPYSVKLSPEIQIWAQGPAVSEYDSPEGQVSPGDYVVQFRHPETSPFVLVMDEQQFRELFVRPEEPPEDARLPGSGP